MVQCAPDAIRVPIIAIRVLIIAIRVLIIAIRVPIIAMRVPIIAIRVPIIAIRVLIVTLNRKRQRTTDDMQHAARSNARWSCTACWNRIACNLHHATPDAYQCSPFERTLVVYGVTEPCKVCSKCDHYIMRYASAVARFLASGCIVRGAAATTRRPGYATNATCTAQLNASRRA
jgi:hypothetical protein